MKFKGKLSGNLHHHPEIRKFIEDNGYEKVPRGIDTKTKLTIFLGGGKLFSLTLVAILTLAFAIAGIGDEITDIIHFGTVETTKGTVTGGGELNMEINERTVCVVDFKYTVNEIEYTGFSYKTEYYPSKGSVVNIEYVPNKPHISRIKGASYSMAGKGSLIPFGIYFIIVLFFLNSQRKCFSHFRLLKNGYFALAKLIEKKETNMSVNYQRVMKLTYAFDSHEGHSKAYTIKTHEISKLVDESKEILLYDPNAKGKVHGLLIDELPAKLSIKPIGNGLWTTKNFGMGHVTSSIIGGFLLGMFLSIFIYVFLG
jgi:hypothetical protein